MNEKAGIVRYVNIIKKLFVAFSVVMLPVFCICLFYAVQRYVAFWIITPALVVVYFVVYGVYAMRVSMGTVTAIQIVGSSVRVYTKRKMFLYDLSDGEISVKEKPNKFIVTFRTSDTQDSFLFYRRVAFTPYHEEQFTKNDILSIYSVLDCETNGSNA